MTAKFCKMLQFICLNFCFPYNGNFSKRYISLFQDKSNFPVLHNITKHYYVTKVSQIVNKCFNG